MLCDDVLTNRNPIHPPLQNNTILFITKIPEFYFEPNGCELQQYQNMEYMD